jgi:hypothetical protein
MVSIDSVADPHPHGSASGIRSSNTDSRCGCESGLSYVKVIAEILITFVIKSVIFKNILSVSLKGQFSEILAPFFDMVRPRPENEPLQNIKFFRNTEKF